MGDPEITIYVVGALSLLVASVVFVFHCISRKNQKNPCNYLIQHVISIHR